MIDHLRYSSFPQRKLSTHQTRQRQILSHQNAIGLRHPCRIVNSCSRASDHHTQRSPTHTATASLIGFFVRYCFVHFEPLGFEPNGDCIKNGRNR